MNTETVRVLPKGEDFEIIVQHDQSGSADRITLSKNAYEQLRQHFVVKPKGTFCQTPDNCQISYYHQIGDYYCSKCKKTGLA